MGGSNKINNTMQNLSGKSGESRENGTKMAQSSLNSTAKTSSKQKPAIGDN